MGRQNIMNTLVAGITQIMCSQITTVISKHWTYPIFKWFAVGHG